MQQNWYAAYTKPGCERKTAQILARKGKETYLPRVYRINQSLWWSRLQYEPLLKSIVFVKSSEIEIRKLGSEMECILSLLYYAEEPAIINEKEIEAMKDFIQVYSKVEIERIDLNRTHEESISRNVIFEKGETILFVKPREIRLNLPSLGFALISKLKEENILGPEIEFTNKRELVQIK
ncbi:MAG: UpxY family transcription antiterminator [Bacteroidota bacterium]|nr:UpxY family transcription antiterminator [Bacteroidota bacterium]